MLDRNVDGYLCSLHSKEAERLRCEAQRHRKQSAMLDRQANVSQIRAALTDGLTPSGQSAQESKP